LRLKHCLKPDPNRKTLKDIKQYDIEVIGEMKKTGRTKREGMPT